jgi:hypothetical protein
MNAATSKASLTRTKNLRAGDVIKHGNQHRTITAIVPVPRPYGTLLRITTVEVTPHVNFARVREDTCSPDSFFSRVIAA